MTSFNLCYAQFTKLMDFEGTSNGNQPYGSLIYDNNFFYGMTKNGGTSNMGVIFKTKPDGTGYSKLLDFTGTMNGSSPYYGSLFSDGTFLYGMTSAGGANNIGVLFKIKPDGTGYSKLVDFDGISNGSHPYGSLILDGPFLYGMTQTGGTSNEGTIFKIKPDGTGYSKLLDFSSITSGINPIGSLFSDGIFLYGMTTAGGTGNCPNGCGTIFKIKLDGTGYSQLLDFSGENGAYAASSFISDGTFLYGMTASGGTGPCFYGCGVLFKIKPDGTGYSKLLDFSGIATGKNPYGSLFSDGTSLYGMTASGGISDSGAVFKIKPDGTEYSKLFDFMGGITTGGYPRGSLVSDGLYLYGMTSYGGSDSLGTIFKLGIVIGILENNEETSFKVYPNPNNGTFTISAKESHHMLTITNVLGQNIYQSEIKNHTSEIDFSKQPKGIYFVKIYDRKKIHLEKIVVQ